MEIARRTRQPRGLRTEMFTNDSVWCCILPMYCSTQTPDDAAPNYLNERWKQTLAVSGFVVVILAAMYCVFKNRSRKRDKRKSSEPCLGDNARFKDFADERPKDSTLAKDTGGVRRIFASDSLTRLTRLVRNVACQTTGYGRDRGLTDSGWRPTAGIRPRGPKPAVVGSGSSGSMTEIHRAVEDFLHVTEQEQLQSGEPISDASYVPADEEPVKPSQQPLSIPVRASEDSDASPKKSHSTSN